MCQSHQDQNEVPCSNSMEKSETEAGGYEERILTHGSNCHKSFQNYKLPWKPAQPCIRSASYKDICLAAGWTDVICIINNCGQRWLIQNNWCNIFFYFHFKTFPLLLPHWIHIPTVIKTPYWHCHILQFPLQCYLKNIIILWRFSI